jgi:uncharacterized membrane protein YoaK (UPF0700 family)/anti-anti-sigma regulatory factor
LGRFWFHTIANCFQSDNASDVLSAQAYSFRLKSRLAISLSWVAGYTNVIVLIACGETVSHMTGNTTRFGNSIGDALLGDRGALVDVLFFACLIGLFLSGAITSGFLTEGARRGGHSSKYALPISIEAILLCLLLAVLTRHPLLSLHTPKDRPALFLLGGIACFAMGLQNATITRISGAVVRTTHLTGVVTDLGLELVLLWLWYRDKASSRTTSRLRRLWQISRRQPSALRVLLLASIFGSFLFGVTAGTILYEKLGPPALLAPMLFLTFIVIKDFFTPIADVREIDPTKDHDLGELAGDLNAILPPDVGIFRLAHHKANRSHRAPDFGAWADRIPQRWKVIILVISPLTHFDTDTAANLLTAAKTLKSHNRTLVISGMNRVQFKSLVDCGLTRVIDLENFVPDLEFAIARGINLAESRPAGLL